jgi:hypothetical protein
VFGASDQADMIARIDATAEDDLTSSFFDSSIQDAENAAVRMFDIGIRTITDEPGRSSQAAFGTSTTTPAAVRRATVAEQPIALGAEGRFEDPAVREAFILGGPQALRS